MAIQFRPKSKTQKWGLGIFLFCGVGALTLFFSGEEDNLSAAIVYLLLSGIGFYLWTARGPSAYFEKRSSDKKASADRSIQVALEKLQEKSGVKAVLAYEALEAMVRKTYKGEAGKKLAELLDSVEFDRSRIESKFIGSVPNIGVGMFASGDAGQVRVYKDWVIAGKAGYDFDVSTRGDVTVDGSIQYGANNQKIDNRKASLHLATQDWSHSFTIHPDKADEARRILNQLTAIVEQMKPQAVSAADVSEAMERLMSSSGKSPAEKLEELSNLRYQRLLSDQEFERAKAKILDI